MPTDPYASLDPLETPDSVETLRLLRPPPQLPPGILDCPKLHREQDDHRAAHYVAMWMAGSSDSALHAYANCGRDVIALRDKETGHVCLARAMCKSRWCPTCSLIRARRIRDNLEASMPKVALRFVTLTLRHHEEPLQKQIDRLYTAFRKLRNTAHWKSRVDGGAYFFEVTHSVKDGLWHPHLHVLTSGRFIDWKTLQSDWLRITGDSHVINVQMVRSRSHVNVYVTKYLTKPLDLVENTTPALLAESIAALKGRRTCGTFGTWTQLKLLASNSDRQFEAIGWLAELRLLDPDENPEAAAIIAAYDNMPAEMLFLELDAHAKPLPPPEPNPNP